MAHPNDAYNTCKNNNTPYNAFHDHLRQFNPPAQTPLLRQRASTGQLNEFLYPSAHLHSPQASSWSQVPNTTPHSHSHQQSQNISQYQTMLPPVFTVATVGTPTPSGSGSTTNSRSFSHKLSVDKNSILCLLQSPKILTGHCWSSCTSHFKWRAQRTRRSHGAAVMLQWLADSLGVRQDTGFQIYLLHGLRVQMEGRSLLKMERICTLHLPLFLISNLQDLLLLNFHYRSLRRSLPKQRTIH